MNVTTEFGSSGQAFITVFDNLTIHKRVKNHHILHHAEMMDFTVGFVLIPPTTWRVNNFTQDDLK
jgi:hypothetical protein